MSNPLLDDTDLPRFDAIEPDHVVPAVDALLAQQRAAIDALVSGAVPRTWDGVMQPQEDLDDRLSRAWAPVSHLHSVRDTPALRDAYGEALEKITDWETELGQNRDLYEAVRAVRDGAGFAALTPVQQRIVTESIRGFELSGVALEEPARSRYREIANELSKLSTEFEQALLDATDAWHLDVADAGALAGLPDSALALLRQYAQEAGTEGWRITLQHPSYVAVLTHADDRALRHTVYEAYATRASDQGPHAGRFDNAPRIERIMALRHEAAGLLGFPNAAEESLATKMAAESARVLGFLRDLAARAKPVAERELAELAVFARDTLGIDALAPWDVAYASEKLRIARYALAEEELTCATTTCWTPAARCWPACTSTCMRAAASAAARGWTSAARGGGTPAACSSRWPSSPAISPRRRASCRRCSPTTTWSPCSTSSATACTTC